MTNRDLWQLEADLGLDIDDLGRLDEACRALQGRLEALIREFGELIQLRQGIDMEPFMTTMLEGGFNEDAAWSRLDDVEEAVDLPGIETLFEILDVLVETRNESLRPGRLRRLLERAGIEFADGRSDGTDIEAHPIKNSPPSRRLTMSLRRTEPRESESIIEAEDPEPQAEELDASMPVLPDAPDSADRRDTSEVPDDPYLDSAIVFRQRFPRLIALGDLQIQPMRWLPAGVEPFATRTANAFRRQRITRWSQLLDLSVDNIATWPNVGLRTIRDVLRILRAIDADEALDLPTVEAPSTPPSVLAAPTPADVIAPVTPPTVLAPPMELIRRLDRRQVSALLTLARWAAILEDPTSLGALVSGQAPASAPQDIHDAINSLRTVAIHPTTDRSDLVRRQARTLAALVDERSWSILTRRRLDEDASTLEELGAEMGVTRERIRQIETKAMDLMNDALMAPEFDELRWTSWRIANSLGSMAPRHSPTTRDLIRSISGLTDDEQTFDVIRLINGTRLRGDWMITGPTLDVNNEVASWAPDGYLSLEEFDRLLWTLGIEALFRDEILAAEPQLIVRLDHVIRRNMAVQDKAFAILSIVEEPRTAEEILNLLDEPYNLAGLRNQLGLDERMIRVGRSQWALASWGLPEYSTIADAIIEEIEQGGGSALLSVIAPLIAERYGVSVVSVRHYAAAPMFVLRDNVVRLRGADEPLVVEPSVKNAPNATMPDESTLWLRVRVDREVLRGSGRQADHGLTAVLGVQPGGTREFTHPSGSVRVTWPLTGMHGGTIGSLRQLVSDAGAEDGDTVRLEFDLAEGTISATKLADAADR